MAEALVTHRGGCHCGAVAFEVDAAADLEVDACNCSICRKCAFLHLIVPAARLRIVRGEDSLSTYQFNTGTAKHLFCRCCGVKSFYVPRSHPDGYSVNVRCIAPGTIRTLTQKMFDGRNWEANAALLRPLDADG